MIFYRITKILITLIIVIILILFIWFRFIRDRLLVDIPYEVSLFSICFFVAIIVFYIFMLFSQIISSGIRNQFFFKLINSLYKPFTDFDNLLKYNSLTITAY